MKKIILFICLIQALRISAQFSTSKISFGILFSDVRSETGTGSGWYNYGNTWKTGFWGSIGVEYKIWKWITFEGNIIYQERKALEVFEFPVGDSVKQTSTAQFARWVFVNYPTSPQSKGFDSPVYDFKHFPNFKYLDLELIPTFKLSKKWELGLGLGLFGGLLLNKQQTTVTQEDLPYEQPFFNPPFNVFGEVRYYRYDFGYIPKVSFSYPFGKKLRIGISAKAYQSLLRMNDTFVWSRYFKENNVHWKAYLIGLDFQYQIRKKK